MYVIKNGMVHKCNTEERYKAFLAAGWKDYKPVKKAKDTGKEE